MPEAIETGMQLGATGADVVLGELVCLFEVGIESAIHAPPPKPIRTSHAQFFFKKRRTFRLPDSGNFAPQRPQIGNWVMLYCSILFLALQDEHVTVSMIYPAV